MERLPIADTTRIDEEATKVETSMTMEEREGHGLMVNNVLT